MPERRKKIVAPSFGYDARLLLYVQGFGFPAGKDTIHLIE